MSALVVSPSPGSWRSGHGQLKHSAYDPAQSFAYTSACSGTRGAASTLLTSAVSCGGPPDGILTRGLVQDSLTDLGRTGDGTKLTYLTLSLSGYGLLDISLLSSYPHIQRLNLASNNLTDLTSLGHLPNLIYLDVSYNKLTTILDFQPTPKNLLEANYSNNEVEEMCDLSYHRSLSKLILDCNQITEINGLKELSRLAHFSIADNRVEAISNLDDLTIKFLRLSGNGIKVIENLNTLSRLQMIDLSGNNISSLRGLQGHPYLADINMEDNQVVDVKEVTHLKGLGMLKTLNLSNNPVETLMDYRPLMVYHLPTLTLLDTRRVDPKEKVAATNRFSPPMEVVAAQNHRLNIAGSSLKPARLRFSTLTRVDEPYPMLVLCGPLGAGKGHFCKLLVEEFPGFFGLGVSHTTRAQRTKEGYGKDYYYIDSNTFLKAEKSGEFLQTANINDWSYGLTMAAIEQVAQQGLACVTHMGIEGVLTMKNTHFEPRYILTLPLTAQVHEQRLRAKGCYTNREIKKALKEVEVYKNFHLEKPGFFDTAINTDNLRNGYSQLRALVMAYGDISPESHLSLSSSSTSSTTSEQTSPQPTTGSQTPLMPDPYEMNTGDSPCSRHAQYDPTTLHHVQNVAKNWSHTRSSILQSQQSHSHSYPGSRPGTRTDSRSRTITPFSDQSRQHKLIKAALAGKMGSVYADSASRPDTSLSKSDQPRTLSQLQSGEEEEEEEEEDSSEGSVLSSESSLSSKLSSERGFSPDGESVSPQSMD